MISKVSSLLEQKKKKKTSVIVTNTKPIPSTSSIRRTTFVSSKNELDKVEKVEKLDKISKPTSKPKVEIPPKSSKLDKTIKTASINPLPNRPEYSRPVTATNVALKQTKENERILGEIDSLIGFDDLDAKMRKRWSDLPTYPQNQKKILEGANPNSEDNNLINQTNKLERQRPHHVRNGSNLSKSQNKEPPVSSNTIYENKLQDVTNLRAPKPKAQTRYEPTLPSGGYSRQNYGGLIEESSALLPNRVKTQPKKSNCITDQNKPKAKLVDRRREGPENLNPNILKVPNYHMSEDDLTPTRRPYELEKSRYDPDESNNTPLGLKPANNEAKNASTGSFYGYLPSLMPKTAKSDISSSGHTPTYSTNAATQRLNTSNLSAKSTNTQASSINKSTLTNENPDKKSTGQVKQSAISSSKSGQIKSKTNLMRFGTNFQKYSDHKTDSTYISGGDSTSPALDCEETLGFNSINLLNAKNDNFPWEKEDFKMRTIELFSMDQRESFQGMANEKSSIGRESMTIEEELANFNPDNTGCAIDPETIDYLIMREIEYAPNPHYFDTKQSNITWIMRAILLDWMMEVCMEYTLKRETYHYAVNYVDRYLSGSPAIQKGELQLIGVTAMYLASKVEEIYPLKVDDFARSADNAYASAQIIEMELKMMKNLKWFLNPPTMNTWANWYMCQWDLYIEHSDFAKSHFLITTCKEGLIQFKHPNEKSYARFREIMQLIDCAMLDIQTLQYKPRDVIASFMYILLGKYFKQFTEQQIYEEFSKSSLYLIDQQIAFNDLFGDFLLYSFGFQLVDLLPSIQYASTFLKLPLNFDLPTAAKINKENVLEGHFEEFLAYQTHHPLNIDYIRRRPRNNF